MGEEFGLLCVHPHPDDESIACGGVLARYVEEGLRVKVVTCTRGEAGENLAGIDLGEDDLVLHRERELADALAALGVTDHEYLGYRDSGMAGTAENEHVESFHRADLYEAAGRLARIIRRCRPHVVVSDDERGTYGHPDHVKAFRVTERAIVMAADEWWSTPDDGGPWEVAKRYVHGLSQSRLRAFHNDLVERGLESPFGEAELTEGDAVPFGMPDDAVTTEVDVGPWLARKRAAMTAHRSQIGEDSFFLNTPSEVSRRAFGVEEFALLQGDPGGTPESDLFAGLPGRTGSG